MIEMVVRGVGRDRERRSAVARLEAPNLAGKARVALPLSHVEAHALAHELRGHATMRGEAFTLLDRVVTGLGATISAVELVLDEDAATIARLRLERPEGALELPLEIGQALGLAVSRRLPLLAAEALLTRADAPVAESPERATASPAEVPEAFLRAFAE